MRSNTLPSCHPKLVSGPCNLQRRMLKQSPTGRVDKVQHDSSRCHKILKQVQDDIFILTIFFYLISDTLNAHSSLFFTNDEMANGSNAQQHPINSENLSLSAILFQDETHWSVWINDRVIHPRNVHELTGFQIDKVTPASVQLSKIEQEGKVVETFTLHPYEGLEN